MKKTRVLAVGLSGNKRMRGVERVVYESLKAVASSSKADSGSLEVELVMGAWQTYYLDLAQHGIRLRIITLPNRTLFRHLFTWFVLPLWSVRFDVLHIFNTIPVGGSLAGKCIVTIHDLAEFAFPRKYSTLQAMYRRVAARHLVKVADTLLTVSTFSKRQIALYLGRSDVRVTSNGVDHILAQKAVPGGSRTPLHGPQRPGDFPATEQRRFFLYYGVVERTKGLDLALAAFVRLKSQHPDFLVDFRIVGEPGNLFNELAPFLERDDVTYTGFVDDAEIAGLVRRATAVLFISEYEGFGFPALEALVLEATVIVSRNTVLEEICSPYCLVAEPYDQASIIAAMLQSLVGQTPQDPKGAARILSEKFAWSTTGRMLIDEYIGS
jgi:glycosyltransferase involved in cell wall biosynthesis